MILRILLPPNLASSAPRDAIPVKIELAEAHGRPTVFPEKASPEQFAALGDQERSAAFALANWCNGKPASFVQLDRAKLTMLIQLLRNTSAFAWANRPGTPIAWNDDELVGISEHLQASPSPAQPSKSAAPAPASNPERRPRPASRASTPTLVDGSEHFLAIQLPSREHPNYESLLELLRANDFRLEPSNRKWWLRDRHKTLNFLGRYWTALEIEYGAEFTANFKRNTAHVRRADVGTEITEDHTGYELHLTIRAGRASEQEIQSNLSTGRHYVDAGKELYLIDAENLSRLQSVQQRLSGDLTRPLLTRSTHRINAARVAEAEELLETLNPNFSPPATWKARSRALRDLSNLEAAPVPESLDTILRGYQKIGASWLYHLFRHELGGILADEMGLGKTLQTLAFLAALPREGATDLVVCPASLVENWRREAARFTPQLRVVVHHGSGRTDQAAPIAAGDLVITSYGTLVRDRDLFAGLDLRCVIADEAQHMKNRRTQNAKALYALQAKGRFLLTGTPVENSLEDLRALFDFILPGLWKPAPSGARGDERLWHDSRLRSFAAPYILRRTKTQVAPELPEKIEQIVYCEPTADQAAFYRQVQEQTEREILDLESRGASENAVRMKTLTQLLRLRQVCCDPRLLKESFPAEFSGKLDAFSELLQEAMDDGHRILVFSQFVSLLSLLRAYLDEQEVPYAYIDGSTRNRQAEVDRFNDSSDIPVFLISLKAGGTGLNLTGADTVVHFDPWWNPAVEAQATDRAHRIGQTRVVTSIKLIMAGTVEERVLQLQESKRSLLSDVFEASEAANAKISLADLKELLN